MTEAERKEKLLKLWAHKIGRHHLDKDLQYIILSKEYNFRTIREIKALMLKDGIDGKEINKIMEGK